MLQFGFGVPGEELQTALAGLLVRERRIMPAEISSDIDMVRNPARAFSVSAWSLPTNHVPTNPPMARRY